ncbi:hypothetical protein [Capnocytophaga sputigena]|jgi:hypothetical protein|uniref:hypothetical protein n=1 Tax=Capnocytophaga sputigena TaxID=1019 RepID=UPI0028D110A8|nr:hypothetical protein [Capnocytophaga sputigena]
MKQLLLFFSFLLCSYVVKAQENAQVYNQVIKTLGIPKDKIDKDLYTEKVLPYDTDKKVMVFPIEKGRPEDSDTWCYDAYIVIYSIGQQKIIHLYKGTDEWCTSTPIEIKSITIDTALFILSEGVRAFGIRVWGSNYDIRVFPRQEEHFSLFLPENKTLRKVLNNYKLAEFTADWDMNEGHSYEEKSMFIMDNKKTNGYFNIKNKKTFIGKEYKGDYEDTSKSTKTVFLKYNGKEYKEE